MLMEWALETLTATGAWTLSVLAAGGSSRPQAPPSLGWRRLDAELAELLSDSALEEAGVIAHARGQTASLRSVTFAAGPLTIDIEIQGDERERRILGQLSPAVAATVELQLSDPGLAPTTTKTDALGRFRASLPATAAAATALRLRVDVPGSGQIETSWVPL